MSDTTAESAPGNRRLWIFRGIAMAAVMIELVRVGVTINTFNDTLDEPFQIAAAVALYGTGKHIAGVEQPPLSRLAAAIPLYFSGVRWPEEYRTSRVLDEFETYAIGDQLIFHSQLDWRQFLWRARLAMLVFPIIAMFYVYLLGRWIGGEMVAMLAVVFFSTDPTLLGHSMWVATDAAACAGFLAATYHGLRWIDAPTMGRAIAAGAAAALAISCKFSDGVIVPAMALVMLLRPISQLKTGGWRNYFRALPQVRQMVIIAIAGFFALWATYLFNVGPMEDQSILKSAEWQRVPAWVRNVPIPMPSFPLGVLRLMSHNRYGHRGYLNGELRMHGWWYYFPEALLLKNTLAVLAGILIALLVLFKSNRRTFWPAMGFVLAPGLFLLTAMMGHIDIGIRHILPVIPFFYLLICSQLAAPRLLPILIALIVCSLIETAGVHPEYISFFNLAAGGPMRGSQFLVDSNLDWGQDISLLGEWLHSNEASGKSYCLRVSMNREPTLLEVLGIDLASRTRKEGDLFIISQTYRCEAIPDTDDRANPMIPPETFFWLDQCPLVKRIGTSILVYDIHGKEPQY